MLRFAFLYFSILLQFEQQERIQQIVHEIHESFPTDLELGQIILDPSLMIGLDSDDPSSYDPLRRKITDEAEKLPFWGEELPKLWIPLQHYIDQLRYKGKKFITMDDLQEYNKTFTIPLEQDNIEVCLRFLHSLGQIIYFCLPGLKENITLDPQFLVTALRSLITSEQFCKENDARKDAYKKLSDTGVISKEAIFAIWGDQFPQLFQYKEYLLTLMEKLDLVATPKIYEDGSIISVDYYYIPCMVKAEPLKWVKIRKRLETSQTTRTVVFDFGEHHLPPAVLYRLMGSCLSMWPLVPEHLYFGCCYLQIDPSLRMLLTGKPEKIIAAFIPRTTMSLVVANGVIDVMEGVLGSIITLYSTPKDGQIFKTLRDKINMPAVSIT